MRPLLVTRMGLIGCSAPPALSAAFTSLRGALGTGAIICSLATVSRLPANPPGVVVVWGANTSVQTNLPVGLTNAVAIAAGGSHMLVLKTDGTLAAWGAGTNASGTNENYGQSIIPSGATSVGAGGAGRYHNLALREGRVLGW